MRPLRPRAPFPGQTGSQVGMGEHQISKTKIESTLLAHHYHQSETAKALGISRSTLRDWMERYQIKASGVQRENSQVTAEMLRDVLHATEGNQSEAARLLEISPALVSRLVKRYDMAIKLPPSDDESRSDWSRRGQAIHERMSPEARHEWLYHVRKGVEASHHKNKEPQERPDSSSEEVGAHKTPWLQDVTISYEEIVQKGRKYPQIAVQHPNCPTDYWWKYAAQCPVEAILSPLYPLLTLEAPNRWKEMERVHIAYWLHRTIDFTLLVPTRALLFADALERLLPVWNDVISDDTLQRAIDLYRRDGSGEELTTAEYQFLQRGMYERMWKQPTQRQQDLFDPLIGGAEREGFTKIAQTLENEGRSNFMDESEWLWKRALWYLSDGQIIGRRGRRR